MKSVRLASASHICPRTKTLGATVIALAACSSPSRGTYFEPPEDAMPSQDGDSSQGRDAGITSRSDAVSSRDRPISTDSSSTAHCNSDFWFLLIGPSESHEVVPGVTLTVDRVDDPSSRLIYQISRVSYTLTRSDSSSISFTDVPEGDRREFTDPTGQFVIYPISVMNGALEFGAQRLCARTCELAYESTVTLQTRDPEHDYSHEGSIERGPYWIHEEVRDPSHWEFIHLEALNQMGLFIGAPPEDYTDYPHPDISLVAHIGTGESTPSVDPFGSVVRQNSVWTGINSRSGEERIYEIGRYRVSIFWSFSQDASQDANSLAHYTINLRVRRYDCMDDNP